MKAPTIFKFFDVVTNWDINNIYWIIRDMVINKTNLDLKDHMSVLSIRGFRIS